MNELKTDEEYQKLLQKSDDSVNVIQPKNFNSEAAEKKLQLMAIGFKKVTDELLTISSGVNLQDCTFHGVLTLNKKTDNDEPVSIYFSNFGNLVTISDPSGWYDPPQSMVKNILSIIEPEGYNYIPNRFLFNDYTGTNPYFKNSSWWRRYFDYL